MARLTGKMMGGCEVNTSMRCLDAIHSSLSQFVQGVKRENVAHVSRALFCPCLACKGVIRIHDRNGTFVAVAEEGAVLYARCSDWTCRCDKEDLQSGLMDVAGGSGTRPWIRLTLEKLEALESEDENTKKKKKRKT